MLTHLSSGLTNAFEITSTTTKLTLIPMKTNLDDAMHFLDVLIMKTLCYPSHQVYQKPSHTDCYINFHSHHHTSIFQSIPNTLIRSPYQLNDQGHLHQELNFVTNTVTTINQYPGRKIITRPNSVINNHPVTLISLPTIKPLPSLLLP
ncbi:uncharacterized protein LOC135154615 [Lytechinus pictus]|uniref:uncharacterized protein LOC135154615 n=1 Tax=Lytechinus pictus TaxID=7653 RepID=UPI0030B9E8BD